MVNCAGSSADKVRSLGFLKTVGIRHTRANYLVYDEGSAGQISHILFYEPENNGKGFMAVPTENKNLLIGTTESDANGEASYATDKGDLSALQSFCRSFLPELNQHLLINQFGSARPNPYLIQDEKTNIADFVILEDENVISMIGIKTPGLTCAAKLGEYAAQKVISLIGSVGENPSFHPIRTPIRKPDIKNYNFETDGEILCRCNLVTE